MKNLQEQRDRLVVELEWYMREFGETDSAIAAIESAKAEEVEPQKHVVEYAGRRSTPKDTREMFGFLVGDIDFPKGTKLYTSPQPGRELRELRELEKDAARYRWLRDVGDTTWLPFSKRVGCAEAKFIDMAIDDAILAAAREVK